LILKGKAATVAEERQPLSPKCSSCEHRSSDETVRSTAETLVEISVASSEPEGQSARV
jgi:hypothetical protein